MQETERRHYWEAEVPIEAKGGETEIRWFKEQGILSISRRYMDKATGLMKYQKVTLAKWELTKHMDLMSLVMTAFGDWINPTDGGDPR